MKNQKILINQFFLKKETSSRVYKVLLFKNKTCLKNNLKFFKFYFIFKFTYFLQFFLKKNFLLKNFYISTIKHDNSFIKINNFFKKKLFVFNFIKFMPINANVELENKTMYLTKNINLYNLIFLELKFFNFFKNNIIFIQTFFVILYLRQYILFTTNQQKNFSVVELC